MRVRAGMPATTVSITRWPQQTRPIGRHSHTPGRNRMPGFRGWAVLMPGGGRPFIMVWGPTGWVRVRAVERIIKPGACREPEAFRLFITVWVPTGWVRVRAAERIIKPGACREPEAFRLFITVWVPTGWVRVRAAERIIKRGGSREPAVFRLFIMGSEWGEARGLPRPIMGE